MTTWRKLGHVWAPDGSRPWARTHALLPTAHVLGDGRVRVYFAGCDEQMFGRIGFVDLDASDPTRVAYEHPDPVLDLGEQGCFDDCGVTPSCVVADGGRLLLYYIGWQRAQRVPYMLFTGLAASTDGGRTFERVSRVPVLDRISDEPFSRGAPFVRREDDGFTAYYWSCTRWSQTGGRVHYNNVIRRIVSRDGVHWPGSGELAVGLDGDAEFSVGRPWVRRTSTGHQMWYTIRAHDRPDRIGYADSLDGRSWTRRDGAAGIAASPGGWDSEMLCYPSIVDAGGRTLMFYNGNGYGRTGFGVAEWTST